MNRDLPPPPPPGGPRRRPPQVMPPQPPRAPQPRHARPPAEQPAFEHPSMPRGPVRRQPPRGDGPDWFGNPSRVTEPTRRPRQLPPDETPTEIITFDEDHDYYAEDDFEDFEDEDAYDDEERAEPEYIEPPDGEDEEPRPRGKKRRVRWLVALAVLVLIGGGAWYGIQAVFGYDDFPGTGDADVVIEIGQGDSTKAIGAELQTAGVVASSKAFVKASADNSDVLSLQPGYYVMKTHMSGASAVAKLTASASRVGVLQIRAGTQLDDVTQPDGTTTPGVFSMLSQASSAQLNEHSTCVPADDLRKLAGTADLAALGAPSWAASAVASSTDPRRIEGLIAQGVYDVKPGWSAQELLGFVLKTSATKIQAAGLATSTTVNGQDPYQVLIIASLIEREGIEQDFEKISRVVYNRLGIKMRLQLDSTVNYLLDKPVVTTTDSDRARPDPYNTYSHTGLPPTPIGAPSPQAIQAALQPAAGDWIYFVKCDKNGMSCFAVTPAEHEQNIALARQRGAY